MNKSLQSVTSKLNMSKGLYFEKIRDFEIKFANDKIGYNFLSTREKLTDCTVLRNI